YFPVVQRHTFARKGHGCRQWSSVPFILQPALFQAFQGLVVIVRMFKRKSCNKGCPDKKTGYQRFVPNVLFCVFHASNNLKKSKKGYFVKVVIKKYFTAKF